MPLSQVYEDKPAEDSTQKKAVGEAKEEIKDPVEEEVIQDNEPSDIEKQAMAKGWNPDGVEGKPNLTAEEFIRNEQFFDKIHKQNRQIKGLEKQLDEMAKQHNKIAEIERDKAMEALKAKKKDALANEDYDKVIELDDEIAKVRNTKIEAAPDKTSDQPEVDPDFYTWQARNTWYDPEKDPELFAEATAIGEAYNKITGLAGMELYEHVASRMKKLYPEKFGVASSIQNPSVETSARSPRPRAGNKKAFSRADLNDVQKRVCDRYVKNGLMSEKEYIDELVRIGELG